MILGNLQPSFTTETYCFPPNLLNIILPFYYRSSRLMFFKGSSARFCTYIFCLHNLIACPAHYSLLHFVVMTTLADKQIMEFLHCSQTSSLLFGSKYFTMHFVFINSFCEIALNSFCDSVRTKSSSSLHKSGEKTLRRL